jgi:hypothetical protein
VLELVVRGLPALVVSLAGAVEPSVSAGQSEQV